MSASPVSKFLQTSLAPEIQELISIPRLNRELAPGFPYMLQASGSHLLMLEATGLIPREAASRIAQALLAMQEEGVEAIAPNPLLEDAYFNCEARLMELATPKYGGLLHVGRSRNDLGATMERMRARELLLDALEHGANLLQLLAERGVEHAQTIMTGYTHLQAAQPITFGYFMTGIGSALARDLERLHQAWARTNLCPLGAGALAATSFPLDRDMTARLLAFDSPLAHGLDAVASRDFAIEILFGLVGAATTLSRMATDMYVFSTSEFDLIEFPDSVAGTSSIMPQKKNLAFVEHLRAKPAHVLAGYTSMVTTVKGTHFTNTMDGNRESMRFFWDTAAEGIIALRLGNLAAANVRPKAQSMLEQSQLNFSCVTDLADLLVRRNGLSFRQAHHVVGAIVHEVMNSGRAPDSINAENVARALRVVADAELRVSEDEIRDSLDPKKSVERRTVKGGPAAGRVGEMAADLKAAAARLSNWISDKRTALATADATLTEELTGLAKD